MDIDTVKGGSESPTDETEKAQEFITCPCCQKPTLQKPLNVKGAVLEHYMACMLTGVPFSHVYPIHNGRLQVTVTNLPRDTHRKLRQASNKLEQLASQDKSLTELVDDLRGALNLYSRIETVELMLGGKQVLLMPSKSVLDAVDVFEASKELTDRARVEAFHANSTDACCVSAVPVPLLSNLIELHNQLFGLLLSVGLDENFWEGIGLA